MKMRQWAGPSPDDPVLIDDQDAISIQAHLELIQGPRGRAFQVAALPVVLAAVAGTQEDMMVLVPNHIAAQMGAARRKGYKAIVIADNEKLIALVVHHLTGQVILRKPHCNRMGRASGYARPHKPKQTCQGGCKPKSQACPTEAQQKPAAAWAAFIDDLCLKVRHPYSIRNVAKR